jgi:biopolymer transport protein ExbB/TolQ
MLLLLAFSILSWAIIITKFRQLRRARQGNTEFFRLFWAALDLSSASRSSAHLAPGGLHQQGAGHFLGDRAVTLENLKGAQAREEGAKAPEVLLKSDQNVPYGLVVKVMSILKEAGVEKLGIVTAPQAQEVKS